MAIGKIMFPSHMALSHMVILATHRRLPEHFLHLFLSVYLYIIRHQKHNISKILWLFTMLAIRQRASYGKGKKGVRCNGPNE